MTAPTVTATDRDQRIALDLLVIVLARDPNPPNRKDALLKYYGDCFKTVSEAYKLYVPKDR